MCSSKNEQWEIVLAKLHKDKWKRCQKRRLVEESTAGYELRWDDQAWNCDDSSSPTDLMGTVGIMYKIPPGPPRRVKRTFSGFKFLSRPMSPLSFADTTYLLSYINPIPIKFRFSMKETRICLNLPPLFVRFQINRRTSSNCCGLLYNMSFNGAGLHKPNTVKSRAEAHLD